METSGDSVDAKESVQKMDVAEETSLQTVIPELASSTISIDNDSMLKSGAGQTSENAEDDAATSPEPADVRPTSPKRIGDDSLDGRRSPKKAKETSTDNDDEAGGNNQGSPMETSETEPEQELIPGAAAASQPSRAQ